MVTRFEIKRSIFLSFVGLVILLVIAAAVWSSAEQYGILKSGGWAYYVVAASQLIVLWFAFLLSLVLFGCIAEYMNREPGLITLGFAYIPVTLYMLALGILDQFLYPFAALSVIAILYVLYCE